MPWGVRRPTIRVSSSPTGALYEFELYLVCGNPPGLDAGVYHFGVKDFSLRRLRHGNWRGVLADATGSEPAIVHAPLLIVCAGTYWRNAWKYQARTYRHFGWDNGTIIANLLAMCAALRLPAKVVMGFVDDEVNRLLDLDTQREVAFSMVAVGWTPEQPPQTPSELRTLDLETVPLSRKEVDYPMMREMHTPSTLVSVKEVHTWRGKTPVKPLYLGAYAQRLGATGLTFFDDDVINFFSPHAAGKSAIFLTAVGKSARRRDLAG